MAALTSGQTKRQGDVGLARACRYQNIMPIVRRRSGFATSGIRYADWIYVSEDACAFRPGSISSESFPMEQLVAFPRG
jgi:hypothetical protein